ncbi:LysR family transcriptional regulator [Pseudomonas brassicacearum]|uniref:LysR family transcriptional regulator n=1 Tax=Pseudomonas brassicacearum TaxID=930166 RepID=UPI000859A045|nr:LysR family transcriptional regulator [Pseudomonas brassicacearum]
MHFGLQHLRHLLALVEHRSFVAASAATNLSQPAFSRSIQALEFQLGGPVVDRNHRDLPLTSQGAVLYRYAQEIIQKVQELSEQVMLNGTKTETVRFGSGPAPSAQVVPLGLASFLKECPQARTQCVVDNWIELNKRLRAEEIDFFVASTKNFEHDPAYHVRRLTHRTWDFYCRKDHPLTSMEEVSCADLFKYPIAATFRAPPIQRLLVEASGDPCFTPAVECENGYTLLEVIINSDAIGTTAQINLDLGELKNSIQVINVIDLPSNANSITTGIVYLAGRALSMTAKKLMDSIEAADRTLYDV